MKYNFDEHVNRRHTNSYKWDLMDGDDVIPMWVADMDFQAAKPIRDALARRVEQGVFGYELVPDEYYKAVISWFERRHQWKINREWMLYTTGVVPALSCSIKALTLPGEKVLVLTPVYNCFFSSILNQGCQIAESELVREGDSYRIDFEDFERKCADEKVSVFVLCNPHNPAGRVWTPEELQHLNDICMRHHVKVISDEIHCELIMPGYKFTPFASVSAECLDNSVTLNSPSKSFNIAGLQMANIICKNEEWRRRIDRVINIFEVCDVNSFAPLAVQTAYNEGEEWLDQLNEYISGNYAELKKIFHEYMPKIEILRLEGTYLVWADISALEFTSDELTEKLLKEGRVYVNSGTMYGRKAGQGYIRINIACPRDTMTEGLIRMAKVLAPYMEDEPLGCPA